MRRAQLLLVFLFATACAPLTCESAEVVHEEHGRRVEIRAEHRAGMGVGAVGAPHAFGILYPTWEDSGIRVTMTVDDRPGVIVGWEPNGDVDAIGDAVGVAISENGQHVAARHGEIWRVFHLLPKGTPFDAPGSEVTESEVDFSTFRSPEDIAVGVLEDHEQGFGTDWELLLAAAEAQDPSPRLDLALLAGWPDGDAHERIVASRLEAGSVDPAFADALFARARTFVETWTESRPRVGVSPPEEAVDRSFVRLGAERLAWLDEHRIGQWEGLEGDPDEWLSWYLSDRRQSRARFEGAPPLPEALARRGAGAARRYLERKVTDGVVTVDRGPVSRATIEWVGVEGSDVDRKWMHDLFLASWPAGDDVVHRTMLEIAGERLGETVADWRTRSLASAERALDGDGYRRAAELLFALDAPQATKDRAFDVLFERREHSLIEDEASEASEGWRRQTVGRIRALEETNPSAFASNRRIGFALALTLDDCEDIVALARFERETRRIPLACRAPAPANPPASPAPP